MDITKVKNALDTIAKSTQGKYGDAEKETASFILAALNNELVQCVGYEDGYFRFCILEKETAGVKTYSEREYEVCFGVNPPKSGKHALAERALRASEFIINLLGLIGKEYNCYVVPEIEINAPNVKDVRNRVFEGEEGVSITEGKSSGVKSAASYNFVYELEVMINAAVDYAGGEKYEYARINDSVVVEVSVVGDKWDFSYSYNEHLRKIVDEKGGESTEDIKPEQLEMVRRVLEKVASNEEKREILEALASNENSKFTQNFLKKLGEMYDVRVGQISVEPCAIYVDRIPNKTFAYTVKADGSSQGFVLKLTWNKKPNEFKKDIPLYLVTDGEGRFDGLTYEKEYKDGESVKTRESYDKDCKLVVAYGYNGKKPALNQKPVPTKLSIVPVNPEGAEQGKPFKGVSDWATKVTAISDKFFNAEEKAGKGGVLYDSAYYAWDCLEKIEPFKVDGKTLYEGGVYLTSDCAEFEYQGDGARIWQGDLGEMQLPYIDPQGVEKKGFLPAKFEKISALKKNCPCCKTVYYADNERWNKYLKKRELFDGNHCCSACENDFETVRTIGGEQRRLTEVYRDHATGKKTKGKILAKGIKSTRGWTMTDENVYTCAECKDLVYCPNGEKVVCDICGKIYCHACAEKTNVGGFKMLDGKCGCKKCCSQPNSITKIQHTLIDRQGILVAYCTDVYLPNEENQGSLFVRVMQDKKPIVGNGKNAVQCSHCGKWIYYDEKAKGNACGTCKGYLGVKCYNEIHASASQYKLLNVEQFYCKGCDKTTLPNNQKLHHQIKKPNVKSYGTVLDFIAEKDVASIVICACCNEKIYYKAGGKEYKTCPICERIYELSCENKMKGGVTTKPFYVKYCPKCEANQSVSDSKGRSYTKVYDSAVASIDRYKVEARKMEIQNSDLKKDWENAPYFSFFDRIRILRAKRKGEKLGKDIIDKKIIKEVVILGDGYFEKSKGISEYVSSNGYFRDVVPPQGVGLNGKINRTKGVQVRDYVRFAIRLVGKTGDYTFLYTEGKITFEGVN